MAGRGERVVTIHGAKMLKEMIRKGIVLHYERVWPQLVAAYIARVGQEDICGKHWLDPDLKIRHLVKALGRKLVVNGVQK